VTGAPASGVPEVDLAAGQRHAASELGLRKPGPIEARVLFGVLLAWSVFQLFQASPLPYLLGGSFVLNHHELRVVHYAFVMLLVFCGYPAFARSRREGVPLTDWVLGALAAATSLYIYVFYDELARRAALPTPLDVSVATAGVLLLLEATRRALGLPLAIVSAAFLAYSFLGSYLPVAISHKSANLSWMADHMWFSTEGVFGIALGISAGLLFLFVLFGALLERSGAGGWFIKVSIALLGHLQGGPAKAAVVSSACFGLISGSTIANMMTIGSFTIPLMKRIGFPAAKAAAIEVSSSINGQLMPPVMGAAAFVMAEFVGIPYSDVVKHAFLPAVISYAALYFIVHIESVRLNLPRLTSRFQRGPLALLFRIVFGAGSLVILSGVLYYGIAWTKDAFGAWSLWALGAAYCAAFLGLLAVAARVPELERDDPDAPLVLPDLRPTILAGLHYLLPVVVLVWCLMVEGLSASLSIYWAIIAQIAQMLAQRPLLAAMRGTGGYVRALRSAGKDVIDGLAVGARNMVSVGVALASAGIIIGVVALTGVSLVLVGVIDTLSGGNLMLMLFLTMVVTIILGMGLPTTANYIVVAATMAPVVVTLASQGGLVVPLIAIHMFVFYFGLFSGATPPVAIDAYAGAALARADPMETCLQSFYYEMRTALLPFIFVFNTELLLIGVDSPLHFVMVAVVSLTAMLLFVAAIQNRFLTQSRLYESALLLLVAFTLFRPAFWLDRFWPPFIAIEPAGYENFAKTQPKDGAMRAWVSGANFSGDPVRRLLLLPLGPDGPTGAQRLERSAGLRVAVENGEVIVKNVRVNSPAGKTGIGAGWKLETIEVAAERPAKQWFYLPALALLATLVAVQLSRLRRQSDSSWAGR